MIFEFFRFELRQQLRGPLLWLMAVLFGLLAFFMAGTDAIRLGGAVGNININAPTVIVTILGFFTLIGLLVIGIFIASALLRDFELGTADLFFSSPMRKRDFLIGRFSAALVACLVVYAMVALGVMLAPTMPSIDPARLGHFSLTPYVWGFTVLVLPNLFFTGAMLALLAVSTRSLLSVYVGIIGFFVLWAVAGTITRDLDNVWIATLMDPFGIRAFSRMIRYWSADERNSGLPAVAGYLLANRVVWSAVGLAMAGSAFALFKTQTGGTGKAWLRKKPAPLPAPGAATTTATLTVDPARPQFNRSAVFTQLLRQLTFDTASVLRGIPFLIMLALGALFFLAGATSTESMYGTKIYPVTALMLQTVEGSYSIFLILVVSFYAGELVWKERGAKLGEVTDAMPVPNWLPLIAKMLALVAVVVAFQVIGGLSAVVFQLAHGYTFLEPLVYLKTLLLGSIYFVLLGGVSLVLQVFCNNKFIGFGIMIAFLLLHFFVGYLHFDHNLYNYGATPGAPYSDMNGFGHFWIGKLWFSLYWGLFLLALLLLASALWVRGVAPSGRERVMLAKQRLRGSLGVAMAISLTLFVAVGGRIFWNTNVLNQYVPGDVQLDQQQRYETDYRKYKDLPQPRITAVDLQVDLRPETRSVHITGDYHVRNITRKPIPDVHLQTLPGADYAKLDFGPATLIKDDKALGYRIYRLQTPMQPGEERTMHIDMTLADRGFPNDTAQTQIVENGSFFNSGVMPSFGYNENGQIQDRNERRKRHMGEPTRMPKLEDEAARANTYISSDADWIDYQATVCTAKDQIALSPGYLQKEFVRDGRHCFSYKMDRPMLPFYAFLSARWNVRRDSYQGIPIEIYYDPKHAYNVDRMIYAVKKSLAYYDANFTPYQHHQVRILEFPNYAGFAQSFANMIPFSESIGFIADLRDKDAIDYVFYVTAHEMAHQWWAHQVIGANVQGSTMLSESLAQYSALMVMEKEYGRDKMRRFLKYELDNYLAGRAGEPVEELPLFRVENQQYIHYNKGSLAFYRLREDMGEAAVDRALKKFLQDKGYQQPPYTTSKELLGYLRAEATPEQQRLITDLFEKITFYDNRVETASAKKRPDGKYDVTLDLHADKRYADGKGKETAAPLDDWIDVGVFAQAASGKEADEKTLYLQRVHVTGKTLKLNVVVDGLPYEAGFDPYNKLIDRVSSDNRKKVELP